MAAAWGRRFAATGEWLEVYGETEPRSIPLEKLLTTETDTAHPFTAFLYIWTFGYPEGDTPQAEVRLLFPAADDWRVKDVQALVYHLPPVQDEHTWRTALAEDLQAVKPALEVAGKVTATLAGLPELNTAAATIAHLKMRSAPQLKKDGWYAKRVHRTVDGKLHHGVAWILPAKFLQQIGTRVTGALLVQFINATAADIEPVSIGSRLLACAKLDRKRLGFTRSSVDLAYASLPLIVTPESTSP